MAIRLCLDLNVWCGAYLSRSHGRSGTAAQTIVETVSRGECDAGALALVVSWGMIERLSAVLTREFNFAAEVVDDITKGIVDLAVGGPSLTLGGVGVLPIHDGEDRHVLETAWSGGADILTTADLRGFLAVDSEVLIPGRVYRLKRADRRLIVAHPFDIAAWLRGEASFT